MICDVKLGRDSYMASPNIWLYGLAYFVRTMPIHYMFIDLVQIANLIPRSTKS